MDDVIEKIDLRQCELLDKLGQMKPEDANYGPIVDHIATLGRTKTESLREDNTRLNNNEVNDLNRRKIETEEAKLEIERERIKVEKLKTGVGFAETLIDKAALCGFCWISYNADKVSYAVRSIFDVAKSFTKSRRH